MVWTRLTSMTSPQCTLPLKRGMRAFLLQACAQSADLPCRFRDFPNQSGATPLLLAADRGYAEVVRILLTAVSEHALDATKACGLTPLLMAAQNGRADVANLLLGARAKVETRRSTGGQTPLHAAALYGNAKVYELLLSRGAHPPRNTVYELLASRGARPAGAGAALD